MIKKSISIRLNPEILNNLRDVVHWHKGFTITEFIEVCLEEALKGFLPVPSRKGATLRRGARKKRDDE